MSFDINWEKLVEDDSITRSIRDFLDEQFKSISLPSFIDNLSVTDFSLGLRPPEVTIRHIGDPFDDFYDEDGDDIGNRPTSDPRNIPTASSDEDSDSDTVEDENITNNFSINSRDLTSQEFPSVNEHDRNGELASPFTVLDRVGLREQRAPLDSVSMIIGNSNFNYLQNYNVNNVGLGNLNNVNTHNGTESPSTMLNHNSSFKLANNSSFSRHISESNGLILRPDGPSSHYQHQYSKSEHELNENDIQIIAEIKYNGDLRLEIVVNLLVNYPSPHFICLPIKLHVTELEIHSIVAIAYIRNSIFVSFLCDVSDSGSDYFTTSSNPTDDLQNISNTGGNFVEYNTNPVNRERIDIIKKVRIESEIGEAEHNTLRNVGKVEKFLVEQLRNIIRDEIAWPSWVCFDLNEDNDLDNDEESFDERNVNQKQNFNTSTHPASFE